MKQNKQEYLLHIGAWLSLFSIYLIIYFQYTSLQISVLRALANMLPMAILFYFNSYLVNRFLEKKLYINFAIWTFLIFVFVTFFRSEINLLFPDFSQI